MSATPEGCARELLEVVPLVMRDIRHQMRNQRSTELTVPQFRTLVFVENNSGASLSEVADHMGLTLPSTSKLVDDLLKNGFVTREEQAADRRRVSLTVTLRGRTILDASRKETLRYLSQKLGSANAEEKVAIIQAMKTLRTVFQESKN